MFDKIVTLLREKHWQLNPLYQLRKNYIFVKFILPTLNFKIPITVHRVHWKVWVHFMRDLSWIINSKVHNPSLASLFLAIDSVFKPKVFWDVGANIGFFSWILLSRNPEIKVVLFEPDPTNTSLLKKTIQNAKSDNVQLINCAVSNEIGEASFAVDQVTGATGTLEVKIPTFIQRQYSANPQLITVKTITLDSMIDPNGMLPPDLIKIDVEGADKKVFEGALKTIKEYQPLLIIECSQESKDYIFSQLENLEYLTYDAEKIDGDAIRAYNLLAIPKHYHSQINQLLEAWKSEQAIYFQK